MASTLDAFLGLDKVLTTRAQSLETPDLYRQGKQPMKYMAPALEEEFGGRIAQLVVNWPQIIVEQYEHVLDVTGFLVPTAQGDTTGTKTKVDDELWQVWKANSLSEGSSLLHTESIALGCGYTITGPGEGDDDAPIVSVESPMQAYARRSPRTRKVEAGIKRWSEGEGDDKVEWGTLYLPDRRVTFRKAGKDWVQDVEWVHSLSTSLIVPFPNRPRMLEPDGISEFSDVIPTADAINKMLTDMMISAEFHAMPRRYVFGLRKEDFEDEQGNPISDWKKLAGGVWASEVPGNEVNVGQFPEADLANFHSSVKVLFQIASIQAALPSYVASFSSEGNPASADAIKAAEITKTKRAERKTTVLGSSWSETARNICRVMGKDAPELDGIETQWRSVATPTIAQVADASVKLVQQGIIPPQQARQDLGYTPEQQTRMAYWDRKNLTDPFIARNDRGVDVEEV